MSQCNNAPHLCLASSAAVGARVAVRAGRAYRSAAEERACRVATGATGTARRLRSRPRTRVAQAVPTAPHTTTYERKQSPKCGTCLRNYHQAKKIAFMNNTFK